MPEDTRFDRIQAVAVGFGYALTTGGVTYVNPRLSSHIICGARHYPLGLWICLLALPCAVLSLYLTRRFRRWYVRAVLPGATLLTMGLCSLPNFLPELPHGGVLESLLCGGTLGWLFWLSVLSICAGLIHFSPLKDVRLDNPEMDNNAKTERIKEYVTVWRTAAFGIAFGYAALLIQWCNFIWTVSPQLVKDPAEQWLMTQFAMWQLSALSVYVIVMLVLESLRKASKAADLLFEIKRFDRSKPELTTVV